MVGERRNLVLSLFFSSRRRHTRSKRDWSSDVCSSDLTYGSSGVRRAWKARCALRASCSPRSWTGTDDEIGRASCRERVWVSVGDVALKEKRWLVVVQLGRLIIR